MARSAAVEALLALLVATLWVAIVRPGPLDLPFFWDEADVYAPGARWVAEHGLNVTPGVFDDDYSRGHPPLFYLLAGAAFLLFGVSTTVAHLVVLPFTVLALACTYLLGAWTFRREVGLAAALLLATTPLFLSIGNMLLPEMPLTGLSALALVCLARGRLVPAVLLGVAMVWIKETGIFTAAAIGVGVLVEQHARRKLDARAIALATVPLWALGAFFVWQKVYAGYFVFPHHANLFADRPLDLENLATVWPSLLLWHGRWVLALGACLAVGLGARRIEDPRRRAVVAACLSLVLFNAIFFTKMFWLERYALPAHPGLLVVLCGLLFEGLRRLAPRLRQTVRWAAVAMVAFLGMVGLCAPTAHDAEEHGFAYADVIATHRAAFGSLVDADEPVLTAWPMTVELERPWLGYVDAPRLVVNERWDDGPFDAAIVNAGSWRADELRERAEAAGLHHTDTFEVGVAPALEVFRR